jgi:hypothetical protein
MQPLQSDCNCIGMYALRRLWRPCHHAPTTWIAELDERTVESAHDRARIDTRLAHVRETLEAEPALCAGEEKVN